MGRIHKVDGGWVEVLRAAQQRGCHGRAGYSLPLAAPAHQQHRLLRYETLTFGTPGTMDFCSMSTLRLACRR